MSTLGVTPAACTCLNTFLRPPPPTLQFRPTLKRCCYHESNPNPNPRNPRNPNPNAQPEHKIQSRDLRSGSMSDAASTGMTVKLAPVPKMLGLLRKSWAPLAYHVSFKLETDEEILAFKVRFPV